MNLQPLFEKQRQLDQYIIKKKGLEGQDLLPNKILALQVELGELANEWRGFKHWSDNQEPKHGYEPLIECDKCGGKGFWFSGERVHCQKCKQTGKVTNPLLEEYIDCLHFMLSIGMELELPTNHVYYTYDLGEEDTIVGQFQTCFNDVAGYCMDGDPYYITELIRDFGSLGTALGFTLEQIEQAYNEKWAENIRRQNAGY